MGGVPSTPRMGTDTASDEAAEFLVKEFVGDKSIPVDSDYWQKLLEIPLDLHWPAHRVRQACQLFAINNCSTRHLAKILIHLSWCLQECASATVSTAPTISKALNALFVSSIFLKYLIENSKSNGLDELHLLLDETEPTPDSISKVFLKESVKSLESDSYSPVPYDSSLHLCADIFLKSQWSKHVSMGKWWIGENVRNLIMYSLLNFIGKTDVSPETYLLYHGLLNFMLIALSTQLLFGPSPGPGDAHPFTDAAMVQESSLVSLFVHKLLLNYITRPRFSLNSLSYTTFSDENQRGVLRRVGSAAANLMLLPFNYLAGSTDDASTSPLAERSLDVLLILSHYRKCSSLDYVNDKSGNNRAESLQNEEMYLLESPFRRAVENLRDTEFSRTDIERNAYSGQIIRLPFASLFDTLGMCLADETSVLLLYSLVHGNSGFLEYVLVRADIDTLLMPMLETLYNASRRPSNHIYMVLIIFLIFSQDSSFNASIHKLMLPDVPWYQERRLHQTSLGSLVVIILVRTVKYNLSKLRDVYLHTNCLGTLANMAPHVHHLSAYASQQLVSLFYMLARKYNKLAENTDDKINMADSDHRGDRLPDDPSSELHIYTDFLRLVLEIINATLTYALPRNPEVVYAIMHRQEVFLPFKSHPRFNELLENIYNVLDFFNIRMDAQNTDGGWSVEKALEVIIHNCRSWRGDGMKMFAQLRFTYQQESHPEEFFVPYVWQLVLSHSDINFNPSNIKLFPVSTEDINGGQKVDKLQNGELN